MNAKDLRRQLREMRRPGQPYPIATLWCTRRNTVRNAVIESVGKDGLITIQGQGGFPIYRHAEEVFRVGG